MQFYTYFLYLLFYGPLEISQWKSHPAKQKKLSLKWTYITREIIKITDFQYEALTAFKMQPYA